MIQEILFIITFFLGIIRLITYTPLFNFHFEPKIFKTLIDFSRIIDYTRFWDGIDNLIFYFSIGYQIWFWFSKFNII